jgi:tetratricopeptide (TPR) repeat protein
LAATSCGGVRVIDRRQKAWFLPAAPPDCAFGARAAKGCGGARVIDRCQKARFLPAALLGCACGARGGLVAALLFAWLLLLSGFLPTTAGAQVRGLTPSQQLQAQGPSRLIDVIDVDEKENQVDITLQFNCSLHYAGHTPASEGPEVRLRLRIDRDCGVAGSLAGGGEITTEIPPISGPRGILTSARLESALGGEVALTLTWAKQESFVLAQGASATGLRIRLLRAHEEKSHVLVTERGETASNYAVNLESQRHPFDNGAVEEAAKRLQTKTFVSEVDNDGEKWYRLRAGPFDQRSVAENVLRLAMKDYPRAWLAVGDDSITNDPNAAIAEPPLPAVEQIGIDAPLDPPERNSLLAQARKAMRARDYPIAVQVLTKLQRQPEFPERADVQEMLGLARERSGEIAHAKAEYEEYLRQYPKGPAADRIRNRLRILRAAAAAGRTGSLDGGGQADHGWKVSGGAEQLYRRDSYGTDFNGPLFSTIVQNAVFTDADLYVHKDGERFTGGFRTNFGYAKMFLPHDIPGVEDRVRISTAFIDLDDKLLGIKGRLGRQNTVADGIFGTFDGATVSYHFAPSWSVRATAGTPVENSGDGLETDRRFETLALDFGPVLSHWDTSVYITQQKNDGLKDRQAVGTQVQYARPGASVVGYVDYDTGYQSLNAAVLTGTLQLPDRWQLTVDAERRNAPLLTTENALIGQICCTTLTQLQQIYNQAQIDELARDRTPTLSTYSASALKQLGERFQAIIDVFYTKLSDTPASGGVEAFPGSAASDTAYQVQLLGSSLLRTNDFNQIVVRYDNTPTYNVVGWQFISRYPVFGAWRVGPRMLFQRKSTDTGYTTIFYAPYGHIDWQRRGHVLEIEGGAEFGKNPAGLEIGNTTRLFFSIGYRINF